MGIGSGYCENTYKMVMEEERREGKTLLVLRGWVRVSQVKR